LSYAADLELILNFRFKFYQKKFEGYQHFRKSAEKKTLAGSVFPDIFVPAPGKAKTTGLRLHLN
jgi:hypothetical protein